METQNVIIFTNEQELNMCLTQAKGYLLSSNVVVTGLSAALNNRKMETEFTLSKITMHIRQAVSTIYFFKWFQKLKNSPEGLKAKWMQLKQMLILTLFVGCGQ